MDFPPGYDPSQANYISGTDQAIGALISILALAAIAAGVVGAELLGGGIILEAGTNDFAYPTIDEADNLVAQGLFNRLQNLPDPQTLETWVPETVDEQVTVDRYTDYLSNLSNGNFGSSFDTDLGVGSFEDLE